MEARQITLAEAQIQLQQKSMEMGELLAQLGEKGAEEATAAGTQMTPQAMLGTAAQFLGRRERDQGGALSLGEMQEYLKREALTPAELLLVRPEGDGDGEVITRFQKQSDEYQFLKNVLPMGEQGTAREGYELGPDGRFRGDFTRLPAFRKLQGMREYLEKKAFVVEYPPGQAFDPVIWSDQLKLAVQMKPTACTRVQQIDLPMAKSVWPVGGQDVLPYKGGATDTDIGEALGTGTGTG